MLSFHWRRTDFHPWCLTAPSIINSLENAPLEFVSLGTPGIRLEFSLVCHLSRALLYANLLGAWNRSSKMEAVWGLRWKSHVVSRCVSALTCGFSPGCTHGSDPVKKSLTMSWSCRSFHHTLIRIKAFDLHRENHYFSFPRMNFPHRKDGRTSQKLGKMGS